MNTKVSDFFLPGDGDDLGYINVRDLSHYEGTRQFISYLWVKYKPYADPHFLQDAKNHFLERFWEMYLAVTLIDRGFRLQRVGNEGPEFYIEQGSKRIWVEAVAPGPGDGPDRVLEPESGVRYQVPTEKILLRFTNAIDIKRQKYKEALQKGIISPDDGYILAINSRAIPYAPSGNMMPFFVQAYLPFGPYSVSMDKHTGGIVDSFYQHRDSVSKQNGANVSTTAFLDPAFAFISAVLHSSVDCVNHPQELGDDFCLLHNPNPTQNIEKTLFNWSKQIDLDGNNLITREPKQMPNSKTAGSLLKRK
ncbi:MAG: hypothetical protein ACXV8Q_13160 [Methylobacter sp.]